MAKPSSKIRAGVDYPKDRIDFDRFFPDDIHCLEYLEALRWGDRFVCPKCSSQVSQPWRTSRGLLVCPSCRAQTSVLAGTIFHRTRTPLRMWFLVAWEIMSQKHGANALGLERALGLGSYRTAWTWLHKYRRAMVLPGRDLLSGVVEADESYVGGEESGLRGRLVVSKAIVAIAAEDRGKAIGRIRLRVVPRVSGPILTGFLSEVVVPGSTIHTDGWQAYGKLADMGYTHEVTVLSHSSSPAHVLMPKVHLVASLLKRWLVGTFHGGVSIEHLPYYLDEYSFRFNRRHSRSRGLLFYRLLEQAVRTPHTPAKAMNLGTGRGLTPGTR